MKYSWPAFILTLILAVIFFSSFNGQITGRVTTSGNVSNISSNSPVFPQSNQSANHSNSTDSFFMIIHKSAAGGNIRETLPWFIGLAGIIVLTGYLTYRFHRKHIRRSDTVSGEFLGVTPAKFYECQNFIIARRQEGMSDETIRKHLAESDWKKEQLDYVFSKTE